MTAVARQDAASTVVRDFSIPLLNGGIAVIKIPFPMSKSTSTNCQARWRYGKAYWSAQTRETGSRLRRLKAEAAHDDSGDDDDRMDPDSLL